MTLFNLFYQLLQSKMLYLMITWTWLIIYLTVYYQFWSRCPRIS